MGVGEVVGKQDNVDNVFTLSQLPLKKNHERKIVLRKIAIIYKTKVKVISPKSSIIYYSWRK